MRSFVIFAVAAAIGLSACAGTRTEGTPHASSGRPSRGSSAAPGSSAASGSSSPAASPVRHSATSRAPAPPPSRADAVLASMTEAERVGQLLMVDNPSTYVSAMTLHDIVALHVGAVILDHNSSLSVGQTRSITDRLQAAAPAGIRLLISTDQEGGLVRRLRGPGFTQMPSALVQGQLSPAALQAQAVTWGRQLKAAGVNVDLAPVLDTVPADSPGNPPIGDLDREYGHDPGTVAAHGVAVAEGFAAAGVAATVKHFPGLGRVGGNTDTASGVTDVVTTANDGYLQPFASAIRAGVPVVMMSTAVYRNLDPGTPAAFSPTIIDSILRKKLGFTGVVISDDLGAAAQVASYSVGERAVDFIAAGGDLVLTVDATQAGTMTAALLEKASADGTFKALIDQAALTVLREKQALGLL